MNPEPKRYQRSRSRQAAYAVIVLGASVAARPGVPVPDPTPEGVSFEESMRRKHPEVKP